MNYSGNLTLIKWQIIVFFVNEREG